MRYLINLFLACVVLVATAQASLATDRVILSAGAQLPVRVEESLTTNSGCKAGEFVQGTLVQDVATSTGEVALPAGTPVRLIVAGCKKAGRIFGRSRMKINLYSVTSRDGADVPVSGFVSSDDARLKVDREGSFHGHRAVIRDAAGDFTAVSIGAGSGIVYGGPIGIAAGTGAGLIAAGIWTLRRGPALALSKGTILTFTLERPVSVVSAGYSDPSAAESESSWNSPVELPSPDLLALASSVQTDPRVVLHESKKIRMKNRPPVDGMFATYLQSLADFNLGNNDKALKLARLAFEESQQLQIPTRARREIAANFVTILKSAKPNWMQDPILQNPEVQKALVSEVPGGGE